MRLPRLFPASHSSFNFNHLKSIGCTTLEPTKVFVPRQRTFPSPFTSVKTISTMSQKPSSTRPVQKRLVVGCDGTWMNSDAGAEKSVTGQSTVQIPSNVTRLIRGLTHFSSTGVTQVAYYQRGIGSDGDLTNKIVGGATGEDITEKIREAYGFVCNNFYPYYQADMNDSTKPWDEIILLGFSRGAFTARAISSLINDVGLLTKEGMEFFFGIIEDWKNQNVPGMEWKWYRAKFGKIDMKTFGWTQYKDTLVKSNLTRSGMPIRAVGVFDTVGSLGIPAGIWTDRVREYSFVNTKVSQSIEYAFHALALDEHRTLFTPTVWEQPDAPNKLKQLKQCWFVGVHSNVGGGYSDAGTSNITLAWMISQLEQNKILEFDSGYKDFVQDLNKQFYERVPKPRPWALGRVYDSTAGLVGALENSLKPPKIRTPGNYHRIDAATGKETKIPLEKTGECIHRSVRVRIDQGGLGMEDDPTSATTFEKIGNGIEKILGKKNPVEKYSKQVQQGDLAPLKGFVITAPMVPSPQSSDISALGNSGYAWKFVDKSLPEDDFLDTERRFLLKHRTFA